MMKKLLLLATAVFGLLSVHAQLVCGLQNYDHAGCEHGLQGTDEDQFSYVAPPADFEFGAERAVVINVTYNGFDVAAQNAFQFAVDIWASTLTSAVPIAIEATWAPIGGSTLGFAGADGYYRNFTNAPEPDTFYPSALANKLRGQDLNFGSTDLSCTFNSNSNWYFGTDGNTPGGQYDFVTVVLHELCHGLGFIGSGNVSGSQGFIGLSGDPIIYDTYTETLDGTDITSFVNGSTALGDALTSNQVYWNGTVGLANNNGTRPRMYAPGTWNGGSSYSHLNEGTYGSGNINSLMTPFIGTAEANHNPGPIVEGIFTDIGWGSLGGCIINSITTGTQTTCNPATNSYNQQIIIDYDGQPATGLINVNGSLFTIQGSPQTISLNNLPSDGQPVDVTVFFSQDPGCTVTSNNLFTAPEACCALPRITAVDVDNKEITLTNYGTCSVDLSQYQLCSEFFCAIVGTLPVQSGSINLSDGASVTLQWNAWTPTADGADMSLYLPSPSYTNPDDMLDFVQWSSSPNGREPVAVAKGIWASGTFVDNISPYSYTGDGTSEYGVEFWQGTVPPCSIDALFTGTQTSCDPVTNNYLQNLAVEFTNEPETGSITVNGVDFAIGASPQLIVLDNLDSDGLPVDVIVSFTDNPSCTATFSSAFTAPALCFCPTDFNGDGTTDIQDFLGFLGNFGCSDCAEDLNGSGVAGSDDLLIFLGGFGLACP
ncbi:MAG: hypothetical protein P8H59_11705 [Flavobacteriales bacterium]|nr:hypothetical protein [Flavobacteriales bacterium]MDG1781611.1 hypothetical protein [Flavobacteriales bacterium]MDG2246753.1 hypothetical protein [Flavobacteriales bacterium]